MDFTPPNCVHWKPCVKCLKDSGECKLKVLEFPSVRYCKEYCTAREKLQGMTDEQVELLAVENNKALQQGESVKIIAPPRKPLLQKLFSLMSALTSGVDVSKERQTARLKVCATCPYLTEKEGAISCGICGCKLSGDGRLIDLVRYEETDKYGCKYPEGSRWKANKI